MPRLTIGALTAALAIAYLTGIQLTTRPGGSYLQGDARSYFAYLPSLVLDRDLDLRNQFGVLQPEGESEYPFGPTRDGRAHNPFPIAPAFLWIPGYVVGLAVDAVAGRARDASFGYRAGAVLGTAVWSIVLAGIGAELTRRTLASLVDPRTALPATLMAWLGTPALYYTVVSPLYSHAPAWASVSLMLWGTWIAWMRGASIAWWGLSGLAAGWVVAVRLQDLPLVAVPAALLALAVSSGRAQVSRAVVWTGAVAAGYVIQGATWYSFDGTLILYGQDPVTAPTLANLGGVLFSVGYRGWISWTPIVLPGLAGLLVVARGSSRPARWLAIGALAAVAGTIVLDVIHPFGAGASYGGRRYVSLTPFIALGLAALLARACDAKRERLVWSAFAALTVWNLWLLLSYEMLVIRHGVYPTLAQTVRYGIGLGAP